MSKPKLKILPLGGLGEIGMNCLVLEWQEQIVLIDCGIQFPGQNYPGVDLLAPDFHYLRENADKVLGVVVTHGHEDHIGAIPYLAMFMPLTVYATPFPEGLIRQKFAEFPAKHPVKFEGIQNRKKFSVGEFVFDPIPVQHSIIESLALSVETPVGTLVHSGDFKHDTMEVNGEVIGFDAFKEAAPKGVRLLMSDSTNAERTGHTLSEADITVSFEEILKGQTTQRIFIALFASNIRRLEGLLFLAHKHGKKVAFAGRSMHSYTQLAFEQRSMKIPPETLILLEHAANCPDDKLIILLTGSQAEPQSALVRMAHGTHKDIKIKAGDQIYLSSRFIPGNEKAITAMIDQLFRLGAEVTYESIHQIHVSGHGFQEELKMMLEANNPECFIPIHGEYRHLAKHAHLAKRCGVKQTQVIENGQEVYLTSKGLELGEKHPLQKTLIVSGKFIEATPELLLQRLNLSKTGVIALTLIRNRRSKKLTHRPFIRPYGLLYPEGEDAKDIAELAEEAADEAYDPKETLEEIEERMRLEVRRVYKNHMIHKPVVLLSVLET